MICRACHETIVSFLSVVIAASQIQQEYVSDSILVNAFPCFMKFATRPVDVFVEWKKAVGARIFSDIDVFCNAGVAWDMDPVTLDADIAVSCAKVDAVESVAVVG